MLDAVAWISIGVAFACAAWIVADEIRHPQKMAVMNFVWPLSALYLSVFGLWFYLIRGRRMRAGMGEAHGSMKRERSVSSLAEAVVAATHCGAGCALADIVTEFLLFAVGATVFGSELYASFVWGLLAAWCLGIVFQYFSIQPMRHLRPMQGVFAAVKADTLSIVAFQLGMYAWMAMGRRIAPGMHPNSAVYWLSMQGAMVLGLLVSIPMNRYLLTSGVKERMS